MILKGSQRGGSAQLATHLLKTTENEHVTVHDVRGFVSQDVRGALHEAYGASMGTQCKQFLFSVSLNPPQNETVHADVFEDALGKIEDRLGLTGQPRVVVFHEKEGRRHAHAVWSRIDAETMTAKQMSFFKGKLREVSKELYLDNGWQMPRGLMDSKERDPKNFSLEEWQQAKRAGLNAGDLKQSIQECWAVSDSRESFALALEERGLYLARGDRRGYVALSYEGDAFSVARYAGKKAKEIKARLGDPAEWRGVEDTKGYIADSIVPTLERHIDDAKADHGARMSILNAERLGMRDKHKQTRLQLGNQQRERQAQEGAQRDARLRGGVMGLWDRITRKRAQTLRENEAQALAAAQRDRDQREAMIAGQLEMRQRLQARLNEARNIHKTTLREMNSIDQQLASGALDPDNLIAPDTEGWNFYAEDRSLQDLLQIYLEPDLLAHLEPHLSDLGALAANELDQLARLADSHPPILHHRDRFGRDRQWIEYHPAYRELEKVAYGRFCIHAMSHRPGVLGWQKPFPATAKHAFTYLFNQAEFGLGCPINVTDSGAHAIRVYGDDALKARFLDRMTSLEFEQLWQGGQYMTEREGGSDVGRLSSTAKWDGENWRITGEKWFCSNADADAVMLLARPEGAGPGTRGLGMFVMPRRLDDGSLNSYRYVRLKEKLGTRSMASAEVTMDGAIAYQLGSLERGFLQMAEMVNWSRLSNGVKSAALMRRAAHDAMSVLRGRVVFGAPLITKPLARRQMLKILLPAEQALSMAFYTADMLDKSEGYGGVAPSQEASAILRLATPVLKFRATRDGRQVAGDSLDMRGGCGYIEDFINPRLLRDAHLGSVWEGTSNIVALDAVTRAVGKLGCQDPLAADLHARLNECPTIPPKFLDIIRQRLDQAVAFIGNVAETPEHEALCRQATSALYHAATAALMTWEATRIYETTGDARRLLWAKLTLDHRLTPQAPFVTPKPRTEDAIAEALLQPAPIPMQVATELL